MKKIRLIIGAIVMGSMLMQVGYAASTSIDSVAYTTEYAVGFDNSKETMNPITDEYIDIESTVEPGGKKLNIEVNNIYPGGGFVIHPTIRNIGKQDVKIESIRFYPVEEVGMEFGKDAIRLYDQLIGIDKDGNTFENKGEYGAFLTKAYVGQNLKSGESVSFPIYMVLNPEVTDLQKTSTRFAVEVKFAQTLPDPPVDPDPNPDPNPDPDPPTKPNPPTSPENPDKPIDIPDEKVPEGSIPVPEQGISTEKVEVPDEIRIIDEKLPGGGKLPQAGGVAPILFYSMGIGCIAVGVMINKGKKKK